MCCDAVGWEQLDLEQALTMSLLAEEQRLKQARAEFKSAPDDDEEGQGEQQQQQQAEAKQSNPNVSTTDTSKFSEAGSSKDSDCDRKQPSSSSPTKAKMRPLSDATSEHTYADPKPLKMTGFGSPMKALPSISKAQQQENLTEMNKSYNEKKKKTEQAFSKNSRQMNDNRSRQVRVAVGAKSRADGWMDACVRRGGAAP